MTQRGWLSFLAVVLSLAGVCGCGLQVYEQRLEATKALYEHFQLLNDNLQTEWKSGPIQLRLPLNFQEIPGPPPATPPADPAAETPPAAPDPRRPTQPTLQLHGLRAAFTRDLTVDGGGKQPGFIYVLSNYDLKRDQKEIFQPLADELATAFGVKIDGWKEETFPNRPSDSFPGVPYRSLEVSSAPEAPAPPRRISLYLHQQGEVQTAVLCILPQKIDGTERLVERIPLCLETLFVSEDEVEAPQQPAATGGATSTAESASPSGPKQGF